MKKTQTIVRNGEMRPEYDFRSMKGGVRAKYVERVRESTNIVVIEPGVLEAFPTERAVNEALKGVLNTARAVRDTGRLPNTYQPSGRQGHRSLLSARRVKEDARPQAIDADSPRSRSQPSSFPVQAVPPMWG